MASSKGGGGSSSFHSGPVCSVCSGRVLITPQNTHETGNVTGATLCEVHESQCHVPPSETAAVTGTIVRGSNGPWRQCCVFYSANTSHRVFLFYPNRRCDTSRACLEHLKNLTRNRNVMWLTACDFYQGYTAHVQPQLHARHRGCDEADAKLPVACKSRSVLTSSITIWLASARRRASPSSSLSERACDLLLLLLLRLDQYGGLRGGLRRDGRERRQTPLPPTLPCLIVVCTSVEHMAPCALCSGVDGILTLLTVPCGRLHHTPQAILSSQ